MLGSIINKFDAEAKSHLERQSLNPFSGGFSRSPSPRLSKDQYGKPVAGSKTEERGQRAKCHILREILDLCNCIHDVGTYNKSHRRQDDSDDEEIHDDEIIVTFGEIFQIYTKINDKVVGLLIAAKKRGFIFFEKEILFQRRDDDVLIALIKPIREIRDTINKELTANASPSPFASREVSPSVEDTSEPSKKKSDKKQTKNTSSQKSITPDKEHNVDNNDNNKTVTQNTTNNTTSREPSPSIKSCIEDSNRLEISEVASNEQELPKNESTENYIIKEIMNNKSVELPINQNDSTENDAKSSNEEKATETTRMIPILEITFEPDSVQENIETVEPPENEPNIGNQTSDVSEDQAIKCNIKEDAIGSPERNVNDEENVQTTEDTTEKLDNVKEQLTSNASEDIGGVAEKQENTIVDTLLGSEVNHSPLSEALVDDSTLLEAPLVLNSSSESPVDLNSSSEAPIVCSNLSDVPVGPNSSSMAPVDGSDSSEALVEGSGSSEAPVESSISTEAPVEGSISLEAPLERSNSSEAPVYLISSSEASLDGSSSSEAPSSAFAGFPPETENHQTEHTPFKKIIIKIDDQASSPSTNYDSEVTSSTSDERLLDELTSSSDRCSSPDPCDAEVEQILQSQINCASLSNVHSETINLKISSDESSEL